MTAPETTPAIERAAPTPDFLPGSRPPVTPRERASDAVWRYENYDGASCVTSRDADGVAAAALTAALDVEEVVALIPAPRTSVHVEDWPADEQDLFRNGFNDGRWTDYTNRAEALDLMRRRKVAEALRAAIVGEA